ncbi:hypothetical protein AX769_01885 [Frondihabitans sp. PAMC 28766]|uniref:insulinase family protein n=1 Tax=Frondihabitans sp. PAMC 28766 TaxID=1795630 RepID=UPI00078BFC9F|nr:insulinase family protein [Frondihabitans sp. PAMC 28766]AMM19114.1 hypothetical protein AX769_01885 [Frondihabitans sp. PAMC 28766]
MQIVTSTTPSGILTRTANVPGRTYGSITFGVGPRDEPVELRGMSHLTLHLVEAALEPKLIPSKAYLDEGSIRLDASGTTAQVLSHFRAVADAVVALGSVTAYELGRAKHLLEVEEPIDYRHPGVDTFTLRYGLGEIGRNGFGSPTIASVGRKDVARWAAAHLTAENAAVALTKPLTASFDLDLPAGARPTRGVPVPLLTTPTLVAFENRGACASLVVESAGSEQLGEAIHLALAERLVDQAGLAYSVDYDHVRVDKQTAVLSYPVEPAFDDLPEVVRILIQSLHDFADDGVSPAAITLAHEYTKLALASDPDSVRESLAGANALDLRGFTPPSREEQLLAAASLTPESVAAAVTAALPSLFVAFDEDASLKKVAKALSLPIDPFQLLQEAPEKLWKKAVKADDVVTFLTKSGADVRSAEAVVTESALLHRYDDATVAAVDFADLVLVGERPNGTLVLVDAAGRWLPFVAADWKQGKQFVKALRKALPAELIRAFPAL